MNSQQYTLQQIEQASQTNRFNVSNTNRHTHNNIDAPYAFQPVLTYGGSLTATGGINFLPSSWTVSVSGATYTVTHNLNTLVYVANAVPQGVEGVGVGIVQTLNTVSFSLFNTFSFIAAANPFNFTLIVLNNKNTQLPIYTGSLISKTQAAPAF